MFAKISEKIAKKLHDNNAIRSEQYEICRFGLQQGLTITLNVVTILAIGIVTGETAKVIHFMVLYFPLRSNAGGYHARNAVMCYIYSIFIIIAIILALKYLVVPPIICVITFILSSAVILILSPVEDANKPLDNIEQKVYKKRTIKITLIESIIFFFAYILNLEGLVFCTVDAIFVMGGVLVAGMIKNKFARISNNVR